jgi:hypothetical protein
MTEESREKSSLKKMAKAAENPTNVFFERYIHSWEKRNWKLNASCNRSDFDKIADELNSLGMKTQTGLEYNGNRVRALWVRMRNRELRLK